MNIIVCPILLQLSIVHGGLLFPNVFVTSPTVIRMTDVGGGCRRLLGEGEDFCLFSTRLLAVSVIGLSNRR